MRLVAYWDWHQGRVGGAFERRSLIYCNEMPGFRVGVWGVQGARC